MSRKPTSKRTRPRPKAVLRLSDLDQARSVVLNRGERLTEKAVCHVVREYAAKAGIDKLAPHDLRRACTALPNRGRGTGADPVSAGSHFDSDNRTLSRLQTEYSRCRQRQNRNRTTRLNESLTLGFADQPPGTAAPDNSRRLAQDAF